MFIFKLPYKSLPLSCWGYFGFMSLWTNDLDWLPVLVLRDLKIRQVRPLAFVLCSSNTRLNLFNLVVSQFLIRELIGVCSIGI